jgi:WD40 repeat protein
VHTLSREHINAVGFVAVAVLGFTAENKSIVVWVEDTVHVISLSESRQIMELRREGQYYDKLHKAKVSPDGHYLAITSRKSEDGATVELWDLNSGQLAMNLDQGDYFEFGFAPNGKILVISKRWWEPAEISLWRVSDGQLLHTTRTSDFEKPDIAFSDDGSVLGAEYPDGTLRLWAVSP